MFSSSAKGFLEAREFIRRLSAVVANSDYNQAESIAKAGCTSHWYHGTLVHMGETPEFLVERVQTGVRIEKRLLKVLKAFAEYHDITLGDLLEGIVLHAFDG
jgi:hypothetical protein